MLYNLQTSSGSIEFDTFDKIEIYKKARSGIKISIILPTYEEGLLIGKLIDDISNELSNYEYEIIVVDDSSPDNTANEVFKKMDEFNLKQKGDHRIVLLSRKKRGVFSAQLDGIKVAGGDIVALMDADFSHSPKKLKELIDILNKNNYDMVSASRFLSGSKIIAPFTRKWSTIALNIFLKSILHLGVSDYSSIFFAIKKEKWNILNFKYDSIWGEAGMEIFKQAELNNLKIKEIPFTYNFREEGESKSDNLIKYGFVYLKRALQIKFFYKNESR